MTGLTRYKISTTVETVDRVSKPMRKITDNVERSGSRMERTFKKLRRSAEGLRGMLDKSGIMGGGGGFGGGGMFGRMGKMGGPAGLVAGLASLPISLSAATAGLTRTTARAEALSLALNMDATPLKALAHEVQLLGFDFDHVNDLADEFFIKLGDKVDGEFTPQILEVADAIGLTVDELEKLSKTDPTTAFTTISDMILALDNAVDARSNADKLFGGEGSRIIGALKAQGLTVEEVTKRYQRLSVMTEQNRKDILAFHREWDDLTAASASRMQRMLSVAARNLTPAISNLTATLTGEKGFLEAMRDGSEMGVKMMADAARGLMGWNAAFMDGYNDLEGRALDSMGAFFRDALGLADDLGDAQDRQAARRASRVSTRREEANEVTQVARAFTLGAETRRDRRQAQRMPEPSLGMVDARTVREERIRRETVATTETNKLIIEDRTGSARLENPRDNSVTLIKTGAAIGGTP